MTVLHTLCNAKISVKGNKNQLWQIKKEIEI